MLSIKRISMRNFFSFGNAPQVLELDSTDLALVLGQNNDASVGDDAAGRRNGVGKSAIIQGIVFGLYGKSIGNDIKIPNLVNKINAKNCEVIIDFEKDGVEYRIERGRNPTFFNFLTLGNEQNVIDDSRGEKKDTQEDLNEILGISQLLFEHIVVLNANVEPFLSLSQQKQREMIEELLGITQLTEKANLLKDMYKETKRQADQEKFKIETITESNKRIQQSIESLQTRANEFEQKKTQTINELTENLQHFEDVDFDSLFVQAEQMEAAIAHNNARVKLENRVNQLAVKHEEYSNTLQTKKNAVLKQIEDLSKFDINAELALHEELEMWNTLDQMLKEANGKKRFKEQQIRTVSNNLADNKSNLEKTRSHLLSLEDNKCPMCESPMKDNHNHDNLKLQAEENIKIWEERINTIQSELDTLQSELNDIEIFDMPDKPKTFYPSVSEAKLHEHKLAELMKKSTEEEVNIYDEELMTAFAELESTEIKDVPDVYSTDEVKDLKRAYESYVTALDREMNSQNPFFEQIETLKSNSIQSVDYDEYNKLVKLADHQDYLTKLLMNKDSFVRRRIIDQNISFLNSRLQYFVEMCGSEHSVKFLNDLSVEIESKGQFFDFKQLSRGERTRVNIAVSCAFRDTYESLYQSINILMCDEYIDVGLDSDGVMKVWNIFQDFSAIRRKNVYVISHKEELINKAEQILMITKEDSFSSIEVGSVEDIF